jgi:hypothetical protein
MKNLKQIIISCIVFLCVANAYAGPATTYLFKVKIVLKNKTSFTAYIPIYGEGFNESFVKYNQSNNNVTVNVTDKNMQQILNSYSKYNLNTPILCYKNLYFPTFKNIKITTLLNNFDPKIKKNQFKTEVGVPDKCFAYTSTNDVVKIMPNEIKYCIFLNCKADFEQLPYNTGETEIEVLDSLGCATLRNTKIKAVAAASPSEDVLTSFYFFSTILTKKELEKEILKHPIFYKNINYRISQKTYQQKKEKAKAALRQKGIFTFFIANYC